LEENPPSLRFSFAAFLRIRLGIFPWVGVLSPGSHLLSFAVAAFPEIFPSVVGVVFRFDFFRGPRYCFLLVPDTWCSEPLPLVVLILFLLQEAATVSSLR